MTERELTAAVLELAGWLGWLSFHARPAMTRSGRWVTAVSGTGVGFPDLTLVGHGRALVAELKVAGRRPTVEQQRWLDAFAAAGVEAFVWTESQWLSGEIEEVLRRSRNARSGIQPPRVHVPPRRPTKGARP